MRYPASGKLEIIGLVERSHLAVGRTLATLGVSRPTFYRWVARYQHLGESGLQDRRWNPIPEAIRQQVIELALERPERSSRGLAVTFTDEREHFIAEASVYRLLKAQDLIGAPAFRFMSAADELHDKTTAPNQLSQSDFTYLKVIGWEWFYLSTVLDDFSRYVIAWRLCTTIKAHDVTATLEDALSASGLSQADVRHRPRLLSDNGSSDIAHDLATWISDNAMTHVRGAPYHPMTQGKIERWNQTMKNRILLEHYYLSGELQASIDTFIEHYNRHRYHESLNNLTPADVYFGRGESILRQRRRIKDKTLKMRRLHHAKTPA